jgi:uncharacterized protein YerC
VTRTRLGEVDAAVLEELRESFDTQALLEAVPRFYCDIIARESIATLDRRFQ